MNNITSKNIISLTLHLKLAWMIDISISLCLANSLIRAIDLVKKFCVTSFECGGAL